MQENGKETNLPNLLRIEDLTKFFGVSRQTIHNWVRGGILKSVKIGHLVYFKSSDVEKYINRNDPSYKIFKKFS